MNSRYSSQRRREYALYRYRKALERGDFDTVSLILKQAERDALLNQLIAELDDSLSAADGLDVPAPTFSTNGHHLTSHVHKEIPTMTVRTRYWEPRLSAGRSNRLAAALGLLIVAFAVISLFLLMIPRQSGVIRFLMQQPTPSPQDLATLYVTDIWGKGDTELATRLMGADFVDHDPMFTDQGESADARPNSLAVFIHNVSLLKHAFPNVTAQVDDVITQGDRVVVRWTYLTGDQQARMLDLTGTDVSVSISNTDILRVADGKIIERWGTNQLSALKAALGVTPVSGASAEAVSAFAKFAYLFSANRMDDMGDVFTEDAQLWASDFGLASVKPRLAKIYADWNGAANFKIVDGYMKGNEFHAVITFDTDNGTVPHHGTLWIEVKDGKIAFYSYYDDPQ